MIEALIIDVDDTLCLTEAICFEMENEVLRHMSRAPMPREVHIKTWGQPLFDAIPTRSPGIDVEAFKEAYHPVIAEYTRSGRFDTIPEANYEALDTLIMLGMRLFVLTSRTYGEVKHMLEPDHFLASRIEAFYHKDNTKFHKPDPRVFGELLSDHDLSPQNSAYIGDSVGDAIAAKQAGLHFIASLESGLKQRGDFDGHEVDRFIYRFPEIVDVVARLKSSD
jgi:phosphoglycolate phosphatase-like HAD superfamily hydrolase